MPKINGSTQIQPSSIPLGNLELAIQQAIQSVNIDLKVPGIPSAVQQTRTLNGNSVFAFVASSDNEIESVKDDMNQKYTRAAVQDPYGTINAGEWVLYENELFVKPFEGSTMIAEPLIVTKKQTLRRALQDISDAIEDLSGNPGGGAPSGPTIVYGMRVAPIPNGDGFIFSNSDYTILGEPIAVYVNGLRVLKSDVEYDSTSKTISFTGVQPEAGAEVVIDVPAAFAPQEV